MSQSGELDVVASHPTIPTQFVTESGTATPAGNVLNVFAGSNLTTTGSGNTVTVLLTNLLTNSLVVGGSSSSFTNLGVATNGQLPIGSTGAPPVLSTLTAGTGVTITNGAGSITISSSGGGLTWVNVTGTTQTIAASHAYLSNNSGTVTFTLPSSSTLGDVFQIVGVQGAWTIAQNANQQIIFGSSSTTAGIGGSLSSTNANDAIQAVASNTSSSSIWIVFASIGNLTVV